MPSIISRFGSREFSSSKRRMAASKRLLSPHRNWLVSLVTPKKVSEDHARWQPALRGDGAWEPPFALGMHREREPTPNPSQEGNCRRADDCLLPSWEGSRVGWFDENGSQRLIWKRRYEKQ